MGFGVVMFIVALVLFIMLMNERSKSKRLTKFLDYLLFQNRVSKHEHDSTISGIGSPYDPPPLQQPFVPAQPFMPGQQPFMQQPQPFAPAQPGMAQPAPQMVQPEMAQPAPETAQTAPEAVQTETAQTSPETAQNVPETVQSVQDTPAAAQPEVQPAAIPQPAQQTAQPVQPTAQPAPQPAPVPQPVQQFPWQSFGQQPAPQPMPAPAPRYNMPANFPPKPTPQMKQSKPVNTAAVMLFIGVAFVILSGVIFSTAQWHTMSDLQRVGMVSLAAAFFFGVSAFAHKKLKLISTGLAFYMLGGVFTGLSFLSLGYFKLLGEWFSTTGDGKSALYAAFALIVTLFFAGASGIYKKTAFTHMALYGGAVSLSLIAFQIANKPDTWALMLNCVAALLIFLTYRGAKLMGEKNDPIFKQFSLIISAIYAVTAIPSLLENVAGEWTIAQIATVALWTAELVFYSIKLDHPVIRGAAPVPLIILISEITASLKLDGIEDEQALKCVIAAAVMLIAFTAFRLIKKLSSAVADGVFISGIFLSALVCTGDSTDLATVIFLMTFAAAAALAHGLGGVPETEQKVFRALSAIPAAVTAGFAGAFIYDKLSPVLDTLSFTSIDGSGKVYFDPFEPFVVAVMFLITAFFYRYSGKIGIKLRSAVSDLLLAIPAAFCCLCSYPAVGYKGGNAVWSAIAMLMFTLLISSYVFERKPKVRAVTYIMRRAYPVAVFLFAYTLSVLGEEIYYVNAGNNEDMRLIVRASICLVLGAAAMVTFINVRKIRTVFSDFALPVLIGLQCYEISDSISGDSVKIASACAWAALSVLLLYAGLERERSGHLVVIRAFSPVMLFMVSDRLSSLLRFSLEKDGRYGNIIVLIVMLAAVAVFAVLTRRAYAGGEEKKQEKNFFAQHQNIWAVATGVLLFTADTYSPDPKRICIPLIIIACISVVLYLICESFKNDLPAALPLLMIYPSAMNFMHIEEYEDRKVYTYVVSVAIFAVFIAFSRLFHRKRLIEKDPHKLFRIDLPAFAALPAVFIVLSSGGGKISVKAAWFTALIMAAASCINLIREVTTEKQSKLYITVSSAFLCMLIWAQPFGEIENKFILWKLNILAVVIFGIIHRMIWKRETKLIKDVGFGIFLSAFIGLVIDALCNQSLANTITVLLVTLTIMLISFGAKSGRWFAVSAATFLGLTLYITRDFLAAVQWWVYLLAAGILLIAIAATNEYLKTRGETLKDKVTKANEHWKK